MTWQRFITTAINDEVLTQEQRFGLHDFKRKETDTKGTRSDKQEASGPRDVPTVRPSAE